MYQLIVFAVALIIVNILQYYKATLTEKQYMFLNVSTVLFFCFFGILLPVLTEMDVSLLQSVFLTTLYYIWFFLTYSLTNAVAMNGATHTIEILQPIQI
jgi:hypothetical protein